MKILRPLKVMAREFIDSFYAKDLPSKEKIGTADSWYVLTDRLKDSVVYSGGVGKDISFELALAARYGARILLFDPSPIGRQTIDSLSLPATISFYPVGLAGTDSVHSFAAPVNPKEGSYKLGNDLGIAFQCRSLSSLFREHGHSRIELLKIDIEGFEYEVIDDILKSKLDIRQITVEFHDFYKDIGADQTKNAISMLKANGYQLFHKRGHDYSFVKS